MVTVRSATVEDAGRCAEIYAPFVTDTWISFELDPPDASEMARRIETALTSYDWLVAEVGEQIVGYAYASAHRSREAYKSSCDVAVYVDPAFSRKGTGRALYGALIESLPEKGVHAVFAGVALPNEASLALHKALGFTTVGIYKEVGWKLGQWRDVEWLQRLL